MRLTNIQVAGLKALASAVQGVPSKADGLDSSHRLAYTMGVIYGKADLASELLQEDSHRSGCPVHADVPCQCITDKGAEFLRLANGGGEMPGG